jgi:hypothetical protein
MSTDAKGWLDRIRGLELPAATGAMVVSKPAAKNTTGRGDTERAISTASIGEAIGRMSAPAALACSRERTSRRETFTGTRSMSPKVTRVTSSSRARWMAS